MCGVVRIKSLDAGRVVVMDILVNAKSSALLTIPQINDCTGLTVPITQVRLSRDATGVQLDVYCAFGATNALSLEVDFYGFFTPDVAFASGVSPLTVESVVSNVIANRQQTAITRVVPDGDETISYIVATSGAAVVMDDTQSGVLNLSGGLTSLPLTLPPNPKNGQVSTFGTSSAITTLTVTAAVGHTGSFSFAAVANQEYAFRFRASNLTWYRIR